MQLFCKGGLVFANHDDGQAIPADAYPDCVRIVVPAGTVLERIGDEPPEGMPDDRPYAAPPVDLVAYAADKRWHVETGGITVGGALVDTSRDSQAMITGAYAYSQANPTEAINYKAASGWVTLDAATMAVIATAVGAHVQACFAVEAQVAVEIEAGTITTTAEIDAADWPG